jgi:large subunit ribosomal protein L6
MSRIGKLPVPVPKGVNVTAEGTTVTVKGPKGELTKTFHPDLAIKVENGNVIVSRPSDEKEHKALHGLTRTLIFNMVEGVTKGYSKTLEIAGVGYKAEPRPYGLQFALGFSHPIEYRAPAGIKLSAPTPTSVQVEGADKVRSRRKSAACVRPSRTRGRASSTRMRSFGERPERQEPSNAKRRTEDRSGSTLQASPPRSQQGVGHDGASTARGVSLVEAHLCAAR